jgi:hypothetical protein
MNRYSIEEDLFNKPFKQPFLYIFLPHKNHNLYTLTEFVSQNPLRVRSLHASQNLHEIINKGREYSKNNSIFFIDNEIILAY